MFPKDVIRLIAKKCDLKTQIKCRLLNKYWYSALDDVYLFPLNFVIADFDAGNKTIYAIYDLKQNKYCEYDVETKIECLDKKLVTNSFEITDIKEIYYQDFPGNGQHILGRTKDSYFFLEEEESATPSYSAWSKRYVYFSNSLTKLIKFGMTEFCRRIFLIFLSK